MEDWRVGKLSHHQASKTELRIVYHFSRVQCTVALFSPGKACQGVNRPQ